MLQAYSSDLLPNWVKEDRNQESRLHREIANLQKRYEAFHFYIDRSEENGTLYAHGTLFTASENAYKIRLYFPEIYPNCQPLPVVMDDDIIQDYRNRTYDFPSNFGLQKQGVAMRITDIGEKWKTDHLATTALDSAVIWLHKYEIWKNQ
ncbi:hypothetical protein GW819_00845 [Candidatus Gracilibacteria bacterium]|nr:hypothetical protein [bacterium]NDK19368.1 hypothetical protein [Candidatus Gracilibacteria bacterium]